FLGLARDLPVAAGLGRRTTAPPPRAEDEATRSHHRDRGDDHRVTATEASPLGCARRSFDEPRARVVAFLEIVSMAHIRLGHRRDLSSWIAPTPIDAVDESPADPGANSSAQRGSSTDRSEGSRGTTRRLRAGHL